MACAPVTLAAQWHLLAARHETVKVRAVAFSFLPAGQLQESRPCVALSPAPIEDDPDRRPHGSHDGPGTLPAWRPGEDDAGRRGGRLGDMVGRI
jgi:hypothetical protein